MFYKWTIWGGVKSNSSKIHWVPVNRGHLLWMVPAKETHKFCKPDIDSWKLVGSTVSPLMENLKKSKAVKTNATPHSPKPPSLFLPTTLYGPETFGYDSRWAHWVKSSQFPYQRKAFTLSSLDLQLVGPTIEPMRLPIVQKPGSPYRRHKRQKGVIPWTRT